MRVLFTGPSRAIWLVGGCMARVGAVVALLAGPVVLLYAVARGLDPPSPLLEAPLHHKAGP